MADLHQYDQVNQQDSTQRDSLQTPSAEGQTAGLEINISPASTSRGTHKVGEQQEIIETRAESKMKPLSPLTASATIVNLLLATGPFTYPQGFVELGPVTSSILMIITCMIAYVTALFMIEAISVAHAIGHAEKFKSEDKQEKEENLADSMFSTNQYKSPIVQRKLFLKDLNTKQSVFYIREKIEISIIAKRIAAPWLKYLIIFMIILYMYGAICLKFVSGAKSFDAGIAYTFWDHADGFKDFLGFDPYYIGILVFGFFSLFFSFGNIENAKVLQVVTTILRFVVTLLMCGGSIYYLDIAGTSMTPVFDWSKQIKHLAQVFGNTTFVFIYHHSISGIIYPVRPQKDIKRMFLYSNIIGTMFLLAEAWLAYFAFAARPNHCDADDAVFPCAVAELYNENFLKIPVVGQIANFYPMLNIAAVPILNITLRNNLLDFLPIKDFLKKHNCCLFLLDDTKKSVKGLWSCILTLPVFLVVFLTRDVQDLVTYTGGLCGAFILLIFPAILAYYARQQDAENKFDDINHNKSGKHQCWIYLTLVWAFLTIVSVIVKVAMGGGGE